MNNFDLNDFKQVLVLKVSFFSVIKLLALINAVKEPVSPVLSQSVMELSYSAHECMCVYNLTLS